ncbi:MAG: hypothetical protein D6790_03185, partial [Caldilineae bacterium]
PNRLADAYVAVGELTHDLQRLAEHTGPATDQQTVEFKVEMPSGLPEAVFSLNWDNQTGYLVLLLEDPDGKPVTPDAERRGDTHHQMVVRNPKAGSWTVRIRVLKPTSEYHFMLSGKTITTLIGAVGGDPAARTVGVPVPIYGILTDEKPIPGAEVYALVSGPGLGPDARAGNLNGSRILQLFDDGAHGDGKPDDGLYANVLTNTTQPGGYTVKLVASGVNNFGETFVRYAGVGFNVRPRAVYIAQDDIDTALAYKKLLEDNGWVVDLMWLPDVAKADLSPYALILVGPETGHRYDFDDKAAAQALAQWNIPVLGLGEGGAALFAELDLFINYGQTWLSNNNNVFAVAPSTVFWNEPLHVEVGATAPLVQLYPQPVTELG